MDDYPYNTDYSPAPVKGKGEPPKLDFSNEDPYDDGLNPARGVINGLLMSVGFLILLYLMYLGADYALTEMLRGG